MRGVDVATIGKSVIEANRKDDDTGTPDNILLMGIDLGTSRSSIVTMDGKRKTDEAYVG